jgi:2-polyprenyl-6-methoxyphenol hydroxylase-like FAD-dependent oxidoreductase
MGDTEHTTVLVAGGGPAGMMLGLLLARAGIAVTVLEKHGDFLRDFRGDTVHASTVRLLDELGLGEGFRRLPQSRLANFQIPGPGGELVTLGDFGRLRPPYDYVAMVPQWDLLDFLAAAAADEPSFTLRMRTEATDLVRDLGRVVGVRYRTADGAEGVIRADLTVACDGRHSVLRTAAGLRPREHPVPFDTWWFRLPRHPDERAELSSLQLAFHDDQILLSIAREDFFQLGYFTEKGADDRLRAEGVERFRARVAALRPDLADRVGAVRGLDDLHVLDVRLNRLRRWHTPGLLCIGDAAHAMSPAGGVGINLAVQDAVAAARLLAGPLRRGRVTPAVLARVRRRRLLPTVVLQGMQRLLHKAIFAPAFSGRRSGVPRAMVFAARHLGVVRGIPARLIAIGPRPEHAPAFARRAGLTAAGSPVRADQG